MNDQDIENNLRTVQAAVVQAAKDAARDPEAVTLVAVSKTKPTETIHKALLAGHRTFGENRVQEAREKWTALKAEFPEARLHLIGPLQTNKIKDALGLFDAIQTVDRPKLATKLADAMAATGHRPDCFIQINTGEEPQKAGVLPADADAFIRACVDDYALPIRGLMCIPPVDEEPALHFALLREIARRNGLSGLSMGMSDDFEVAIRFGATHVRVGSAIFGSR
ncbi:MAG: YggS family pyridoxal phosphate-dependent enzyme [Rhodospirillales bacterium]|nr:YggS family pyridoxal phosphate-dependent enzyme [Rhodospirillales bacterium]